MSNETEPTPAAAPPTEAPPTRSLVDIVRVADPLSIGALITAIIAGLVGVVQTGFMWTARNDEVQAALRAQQLRACVTYSRAAFVVNVNAQRIGAGQIDPDEGEAEFEANMNAYQDALAELYYLLPRRFGPPIDAAGAQAGAAYAAFEQGDTEQVLALSNSQSAWSTQHNAVLDACERVIRDVRDH